MEGIDQSATGTSLVVSPHLLLSISGKVVRPFTVLAEDVVNMVVMPLQFLFVEIRNCNYWTRDTFAWFKAKGGNNPVIAKDLIVLGIRAVGQSHGKWTQRQVINRLAVGQLVAEDHRVALIGVQTVAGGEPGALVLGP